MGCDLRATVHGHKRPDIVAVNPVCFIHTDAAIFAIDEDGVCCYVTSLSGAVPRNANRCRGAEYVACLDLTSDDGLVADPRIGGTGLFVGRGASQKMALLRTGPITRVQFVEDDLAVDASQLDNDGPTKAEDVSQIKPIDEIHRRVEEELDLLDLQVFDALAGPAAALPIAAEMPVLAAMPVPTEPPARTAPRELPAPSMLPPSVLPPSVLPPSVPGQAVALRAPTLPPRRSSRPPAAVDVARASLPALMGPADLLAAALAVADRAAPPAREPAISEVDFGWGGEDPRKTRLGMPVVKLT